MNDQDYKPRFSFEITEEQKNRADRLLAQYGLRKAVFCNILDDVLDIIEEHGGAALGLLLTGATKPRDIIPTMCQAIKEKGNG
jgi:predicted O-methyltransferase YrrM